MSEKQPKDTVSNPPPPHTDTQSGGAAPAAAPADQAALDNRSRQLNSENDAYWKSRGKK